MKLYFAYGSNLCPDDWHEFCGDRPGKLNPVGIGYVPDYRLEFSYRSESRGGGVLNIKPQLGHIVEGLLCRPDEPAWQRLDEKESVGKIYDRRQLTAFDETGHPIPAITYIVRKSSETGVVSPAKSYLSTVRAARERLGIPNDALNAAAEGQVGTPEFNCIFVYGTLLSCQSRGHLMRRLASGPSKPASISGRIYHLGRYPGVRIESNGQHVVHGELVAVQDVAQTFRELDEIEGFDSYDDASPYWRRIVKVRTSLGESLAWTYEYQHPLSESQRIDSGDWRLVSPPSTSTRPTSERQQT